MSTCNHCGALILFGGERLGNLRFCNDECFRAGAVASAAYELAKQVPEELVQDHVLAVHQGNCPRCGGPGPVDVHVSHRVWSAGHHAFWSSRPHVSCRACGVKSQLADALFTLLFGWWGIGCVVVPVQIVRNILGMLRYPDPAAPSPRLEQMVRLDIAKRAAVIQATSADAEPE
jgi:hypothetical protein